MWRLWPILFLTTVLIGCGGRGVVANNMSANSPTVSSTNPGPTTAAPMASASPSVINLADGQSASGVDLVVSRPASSRNESIENLGVNPVSGLGKAANTGGTIHRGSTMRILLFGPGLDSAMSVIVAGPQDITVSSLQSVQATDNTPGVAFNASVAGNAALGARTVYLKSPNGDVTAFTGGLEVIP